MTEWTRPRQWTKSKAIAVSLPYGGNELPSEMIALEPRVMLDGAAAMAAVNEADSQADDGGDAGGDASHAPDPAAQHQTSDTGDGGGISANGSDTGQTGGETAAATVVIVDASVKDPASLLTGIDPSAHVFYLDANADGVNQIASILAGFSKVEALHVLSHGATGSVTLGSTILDAANAESYAAKFVEWDVALADGADILLYGCNVAADNSGRDFIDLIAELTNADVAASDDLTASPHMGGDWDLEVATAAIEAVSPLDASSAEAYGYKLGTSLDPGDIIVIQMSDNNSYSLLLLSDLTSGSTFFITDNGWNENLNQLTPSEFFGSDGTDQITLTANLSAGTVISSTGGAGYTVTANLENGPLFATMNISASGDSLIIYETDTNAFGGVATLLYAFNNADNLNASALPIAQDPTNLGWAATSETPGGAANSDPISHFPNGELTSVNTAGADGTAFGLLGLSGEPDDTRVDFSSFGGTVNLTPQALRQFVHDPAHWTSVNGTSTDFMATTFNISDGPEVTSFTRQTPATSPTNADTLTFLATFSADVTGVGTEDFAVTGTTATVTGVTPVTGSTYQVTVSGGNLANLDGTVGLDLAAAPSINALAGGAALVVAEPATDETYSLDNTAPGAPSAPDLAAGSDSGASNTDNITNDTTPTLTGTAEANATVSVLSSADGLLGTAVANGAGAWSFTPVTALTEGAHSITTTATDAAGNIGAASSALVITIDTTAPGAPIRPILVGASDTGSSQTDKITSDTTPQFLGSAENNSVVTVTSSIDGVLGTAPANVAGNFSFTSPALAEGAHTITYTAVDAAGNIGAVSPGLVVTIDTTAPAAPSTPDLAAASDTGSSDTDNLTSDTTPTLTGTAEAGATVTVISSIDGPLGTVSADGAGAWSFTPVTVLSEGAHSITATATDVAGNVGAASGALVVTIDATAPGAPGAPDLNPASDTGASNTDNITNDTTPTLSGTADANATVTVISSIDGPLGTVTADGAGNWTFTPVTPLSEGAHSITATATDAAGNVSVASSALIVTIDTTAPGAPIRPILDGASDTGSSQTDKITSDTTPLFLGSAENNSVVTVTSSIDGVLGTATANVAGNFSFSSPALAEGTHTITYTAVDAAGNIGAVSPGLVVTIDTTAPAAPSTPDLAAASDTGSSDTDNLTSDTTPTLTGTAEAGATVTVISSIDGPLGSVTADGAGAWSFTPVTVLSEGAHSITATATDVAGNVSAASPALIVTIDASAPAAPGAPDLIAASDTGSSDTDNITSDTTPTLTGTAEANATVTVISAIDGPLGTVIADGAGNWTFTPVTPLSEGAHSITATATDAAGNVSAASPALIVTIDATAPAAPSAPDLLAASDTGASDSDDITASSLPTLTGTAEANATIAVFSAFNGNPAAQIGTATVDGAGAWSFTPAAPLPEGIHVFSATATDAAGNTSVASAGLSVTIDRTPPGAPGGFRLAAASDTGASDSDNVTADNTPTFTGTAEPGATVEVFTGAITYGTTVSDGAGNWSITAGVQPDFTRLISVRATDVAGNSFSITNAFTLTIDTAAPAAPSTPDLADASDTGASNADDITADNTPTLTGTAEANATITVFGAFNGNPAALLGTTTADGAGAWSFTAPVFADGTHVLTATATDLAGNTGIASAGLTVVIDTAAPGAPAGLDLATASDTGISNSDDITANNTPTITGTAEAGAEIALTSNVDGPVGKATADGAGNWSITTAALSENVHSLTATATDAAGNVSPASAGLTVTVDLTPPVLSNLNGGGTFAENGAPVQIDIDVDVSEAALDSLNNYAGAGLVVARNGGANAEDVFSFTPTGGVTLVGTNLQAGGNTFASFTQAGGTLTIAFTSAATPATSALVDAVLQGLAYSNTSEAPPAGVTLDYAFTDTVDLVATGTTQALVNITSVNDAPVNTVPGAQALFEDTSLTFSAANGNLLSIADIDAGAGIVTTTLTASNGTVAATGGGATVSGNGSATVTISGTVAQVNAALSNVIYTPVADFAGAATLTLVTDDAGNAGGGALTDSDTINITVNPVNDGPVNTVPGAQTTVDTTDLVFSAGTGNALSIADIDAGGGAVTTTLTATTGSLAATAGGGAAIAGNGSSTVTITGTVAQVNAALAAVTFTPAPGNVGATTITMATNDGGNTGGGALIDTDTITVDVTSGQASTGTDGRTGTGTNGTGGNGFQSLYSETQGNPLGFDNGVGGQAGGQNGGGGNGGNPLVDDIITGGIGDGTPPNNGGGFIGLDPSSDTGFSGSDNITNDNTPLLVGVAEPNATVVIRSSLGGVLGTAQADANGNWSFTSPVLPDGPQELTATPTDEEGNEGTPSLPLLAVIDTVAPDTPPAPVFDGDIDQLRDDQTPTFKGTAEPGSRIVLTSSTDGVIGEAIADENGNWSVTTDPLSQNVHSVSLTATDAAGNTSPSSPALDIIVRGAADTTGNLDGSDALQQAAASAFQEVDLAVILRGFTESRDSGSELTGEAEGDIRAAAIGFTRQLQKAGNGPRFAAHHAA